MSTTRLLIAVTAVLVVAACGQREGVHPVAAPAVPNERAPSEATTAQPPRVASVATAAPRPQSATPTAAAPAEEVPTAVASEPVEVTHGEAVRRPREEREPVQPPSDRPSPAADEAAPSEEPTETDHGAQLWNRRFRSYRVTTDGEERELVSGTAIAIRFVPRRAGGPDRDGVAWYTGCNWTGGTLAVRPRHLIIRGEGSTAVGCYPEYQRQEDWVDAFMEDDPMWTLDGRELTLVQGSTTISMREVPDRS